MTSMKVFSLMRNRLCQAALARRSQPEKILQRGEREGFTGSKQAPEAATGAEVSKGRYPRDAADQGGGSGENLMLFSLRGEINMKIRGNRLLFPGADATWRTSSAKKSLNFHLKIVSNFLLYFTKPCRSMP
ncbi:hypothetical protein [Geoalkalibacter sp.]|uniref:hypothetical protein n=1 Tax=Geoalkalibacter sp. TaxID=3041440 RepID=UPI00272E6752|nr:hypothetical protein [Geoalkalibacter sp.]